MNAAIDELADFMRGHPRLLVLTGAGVSAGSGIPTYRNHAGVWQRSTPIQHQDFISRHAARQRYWARSMLGWPQVAASAPNAAHKALAGLEAAGHLSLLVTQNVDGLHQRAGHQAVVDLHGNLTRVQCLNCRRILARSMVQTMLEELNGRLENNLIEVRPDGDADVSDEVVARLEIPACPQCGGVLKPDVVFFGDSVPRVTVNRIMQAVEDLDAVLVIGSSLMVFSGFRFCRFAARLGKPVAAINQGVTRADDLLTLKLERDCGETLQALSEKLRC